MTSAHDDEILGKAYDARLMRRLLTYLRPYWRQVGLALVAIIAGAAAQLAQPYLVKLAIDRFIAVRRLDGLERLALAYLAILVAAFALEYLQTARDRVFDRLVIAAFEMKQRQVLRGAPVPAVKRRAVGEKQRLIDVVGHKKKSRAQRRP